MNNIYFIFITICIAILTSTSCSRDDHKESLPYLSIDSDSIQMESRDWDAKINIKTNEDWVVTNKSNWGRLSKTSGKGNANITFSCWDNDNNIDRFDTLIVKTPNFTKNIIVRQKGSRSLYPGSLFAQVVSSNLEVRPFMWEKIGPGSFKPNVLVDFILPVGYKMYYDGSSSSLKKESFTIIYYIEATHNQLAKKVYIRLYYDYFEDSEDRISFAKERFINPSIVDVQYNSWTIGTMYDGKVYNLKPNLKNSNFSSSKDGDYIYLTFKDIKTSIYPGYNYYLNGTVKMKFML